ncbi:MAG: cytidine deaminase [Calditrichia bacterium]|nr:cytidine deaminase [Calditrichia bacterium]
MNKDDIKLIERASEIRKNAQAPFSKFYVGAALLTESDEIFTGVNVESSSYGLTICAERVALSKALSEGYTKFKKMAIVVDNKKLTPPCGACRQLLYDYAPELDIIISDGKGITKDFKLIELFPEPFGMDFL